VTHAPTRPAQQPKPSSQIVSQSSSLPLQISSGGEHAVAHRQSLQKRLPNVPQLVEHSRTGSPSHSSPGSATPLPQTDTDPSSRSSASPSGRWPVEQAIEPARIAAIARQLRTRISAARSLAAAGPEHDLRQLVGAAAVPPTLPSAQLTALPPEPRILPLVCHSGRAKTSQGFRVHRP
jgi:hypothetical protein